MAKIIIPGDGVVFMKVGVHAQETLEDIVSRKQKEYEEAGMIFWGYGGNTCHPTNLVQPFAIGREKLGQRVHIVMNKIESRHFAEPELAREYSDDGITWKPIPQGIYVKGSRYAMILGDLQEADFDLNLRETSVAVGPSRGLRGDEYIQRHVDKGCLVIGDPSEAGGGGELRHIGLVAPLQAPYAVFVK
jgi:hypothetical protein